MTTTPALMMLSDSSVYLMALSDAPGDGSTHMGTNQYTVGTLVRVSVVVTVAAGGAAIDPSAVTLAMELPDSSLVDLTGSIVHDSTGNYHADYAPSLFGLFQYEWTGTGAAQVSQVGSFFVNQSAL